MTSRCFTCEHNSSQGSTGTLSNVKRWCKSQHVESLQPFDFLLLKHCRVQPFKVCHFDHLQGPFHHISPLPGQTSRWWWQRQHDDFASNVRRAAPSAFSSPPTSIPTALSTWSTKKGDWWDKFAQCQKRQRTRFYITVVFQAKLSGTAFWHSQCSASEESTRNLFAHPHLNGICGFALKSRRKTSILDIIWCSLHHLNTQIKSWKNIPKLRCQFPPISRLF